MKFLPNFKIYWVILNLIWLHLISQYFIVSGFYFYVWLYPWSLAPFSNLILLNSEANLFSNLRTTYNCKNSTPKKPNWKSSTLNLILHTLYHIDYAWMLSLYLFYCTLTLYCTNVNANFLCALLSLFFL